MIEAGSGRAAPMTRRRLRMVTPLLIAAVWIGFGFFCKVLDLVPRHEEIVARILGADHAAPLTRAIGGLEVLMGVWVLSGVARRASAVVQIGLVTVMNLLELFLARDLLLWGPFNGLVALGFIAVVYVNEWKLGERVAR